MFIPASHYGTPAAPANVPFQPVEIRSLTLAYGGGRPVLDDVTLQMRQGQFVSLVGPSGCGKTTLLNLCAGLVPWDGSDQVQVLGGAPILGSRRVAYMLARDSLFPWLTALENAAFGLRMRGVPKEQRLRRAREMLDAVGLSSYGDAFPKQLSHGMRQRVALARTFALDSELLLMDEPFGALDAQTKLQLEDLLATLCQQFNRSVLFVTHDLGEAVALSDRVVVMSSRPGRIVADVQIDLPRPRSVRALQAAPRFHELYRELWTHLAAGWSTSHV